MSALRLHCFFFFQAEDGIRYSMVTGVQTCALPIWRWRVLHDLRAHGAVLLANARVSEIGERAVSCEIRGADGSTEKREIPADTVVLATGLSGDTRLADALRAGGLSRVEVIGDAGGVGYLEGAIHSGFHAAI